MLQGEGSHGDNGSVLVIGEAVAEKKEPLPPTITSVVSPFFLALPNNFPILSPSSAILLWKEEQEQDSVQKPAREPMRGILKCKFVVCARNHCTVHAPQSCTLANSLVKGVTNLFQEEEQQLP